mmetsp:Transcript_1772/g.2298  ORF Transcript_1772/g.2298 Transcript_1772/m.2298 type:complete len:89 (+) Transcript_1772:1105-1371(+)
MISMANSESMAENMKTIQMQNQQFKVMKDNNEYFVQFLLDIGFSKIEGEDPQHADAKFKYVHQEEPEEGLAITKGNKKNLAFVLSILK